MKYCWVGIIKNVYFQTNLHRLKNRFSKFSKKDLNILKENKKINFCDVTKIRKNGDYVYI